MSQEAAVQATGLPGRGMLNPDARSSGATGGVAALREVSPERLQWVGQRTETLASAVTAAQQYVVGASANLRTRLGHFAVMLVGVIAKAPL